MRSNQKEPLTENRLFVIKYNWSSSNIRVRLSHCRWKPISYSLWWLKNIFAEKAFVSWGLLYNIKRRYYQSIFYWIIKRLTVKVSSRTIFGEFIIWAKRKRFVLKTLERFWKKNKNWLLFNIKGKIRWNKLKTE